MDVDMTSRALDRAGFAVSPTGMRQCTVQHDTVQHDTVQHDTGARPLDEAELSRLVLSHA